MKPLKQKTDGAMPTKKPALLLMYNKFVAEGRSRARFSDCEVIAPNGAECTDLVAINDDCDDYDEVAQMEMI